jgi:hypothetical protein
MRTERELSSEEHSELVAMLPDAYKLLGFKEETHQGHSVEVIAKIDNLVGELLVKNMSDDDANSTAFTLGFLLGEIWRDSFEWEWRYIAQDNGFASYGVVSPDKSFVYFAMKDIYQLLIDSNDELNIMLLFNMVKAGSLPKTEKKYISLG